MKHFKIEEFDSPGFPGSGKKFMKEQLLSAIDNARDIANIPFNITSGYRTIEHNKKVGGSPTSSHLNGWAVDIACDNSGTREIILSALFSAGFKRIGIAHTFIHCDVDPNKQDYVWLYS